MSYRPQISEPDAFLYRVGTLDYTKSSLAKLFVWLLWGDLCYMLMESVVPSILPLQFQKLGASNTTIGLIMTTIPMAITAVVNPIVSFRSDRYRSRFGRRIPFIVATLPFLVLSLFALGYSNAIGAWFHRSYGITLGMSPTASIVWTIGIFVVAFTFFNSFVSSVFWYLFNDVVPEKLLARFMSLFRLVSMMSASIYNLFVFRYAGTHSTEILVGAGLLYFFGFGLMCLMVKEGRYPQPPAYVDGQSGILSAVKSFAKECLTLPHYWLLFSTSVFSSLAGAASIFMLFFYQSTGLDLIQIGRVNGAMNIAVAVMIPISGLLADRYSPIRVVLAGYILTLVLALPASLIWLFWHPLPGAAFWFWIFVSIALTAPATALLGIYDPPLLMVTFPRSRYGQYCSANAMLRSLAGIAGGLLAGVFFDLMKHFVRQSDVYRFMPLWQFAFSLPAMICMLHLYRSWKRYGGDKSYVPPIPGETVDEVRHEEIAEEEIGVTVAAR